MSDRTGGPAYPIPIAGCSNGSVYNTLEQSGGQLGGMSLRDRVSIAALQSILTWEDGWSKRDDETYEQALARLAFDYADAWLAERVERDKC